MSYRFSAACLGILLLSACGGPPYRQTESLASERSRDVAIPLDFAPGSAALLPRDYPVLQSLRSDLGPGASLTLVAEGTLATERAASVSGFLGRAVRPAEPARTGVLTPDTASLQMHETRLTADACEGAGVAVGRNLWPGDDASRQRLMPPGCATSQALLRQVESPADVLHGRALAAGAAGPFVQAIQRYYERNDAGPVNARAPHRLNDQGYLNGQGSETQAVGQTQGETQSMGSSQPRGGSPSGQDLMAPVPQSSPRVSQGSP
jgi:hypothetical protein